MTPEQRIESVRLALEIMTRIHDRTLTEGQARELLIRLDLDLSIKGSEATVVGHGG